MCDRDLYAWEEKRLAIDIFLNHRDEMVYIVRKRGDIIIHENKDSDVIDR